jgi:SAM-dependent methyltransferase
MNKDVTDAKNFAYANQDRGLKNHEEIMLQLIDKHIELDAIDVLDIGCADGIFLEELSSHKKCSLVDGLDNDLALVERARGRKYKAKSSEIYFNDVLDLLNDQNPLGGKKYDVIIASGIFAFFENIDDIAQAFSSLLKETGKIFIFNRCNSRDLDIKYSVRPTTSVQWGQSIHVLSIDGFLNSLSKSFCDFEVQKFELDFDIEERDSIYAGYTVKKQDGSRMVLTRYNFQNEYFFVVANKLRGV